VRLSTAIQSTSSLVLGRLRSRVMLRISKNVSMAWSTSDSSIFG
jgi:hypothetical protein